MTPALVFLHGWGASGRVFDALREELADLPSQAPDLLPGAQQTLDDWARRVAQDLPEACTLAGWSLGGLLALRIARLFPAKVSRLILLGASPCFVAQADWPWAMPAQTADQFARDFSAQPAATHKRFVSLQTLGDSQRKSIAPTLIHSAAPLLAEHASLQQGLRILFETDLRQQLPSHLPALILHGAHDALMPVGAAQALASQWPASTLHIYAQAAHAVFLHAPQDCAERIRKFIHAS